MTLGLDNTTLDSFVPVYDAIPAKWEDARPFVVEQLKMMANAINIREIGWFLDEELISGRFIFPVARLQIMPVQMKILGQFFVK